MITTILGPILLLTQSAPIAPSLGASVYAVSDDGKWVSVDSVAHLWRVADWKDFGPDRTNVFFDPKSKTAYVADYSQSSYMFQGRKDVLGDSATIRYTIRDSKLWGTVHRIDLLKYNRTGLPSGSKLCTFLYKDKRGAHPNREVVLTPPKSGVRRNLAIAFASPTRLRLLNWIAAPAPNRNTLEGIEIRVDGTIRRRFTRHFSTKEIHMAAGKGKYAASTEGLVFQSGSDPSRLIYLRGMDGKRTTIPLPDGARAGRMFASPTDVFVVEGGRTRRYALAKRVWEAIEGLELLAVSGNGDFGAFARPGNRRLEVRRLRPQESAGR